LLIFRDTAEPQRNNDNKLAHSLRHEYLGETIKFA